MFRFHFILNFDNTMELFYEYVISRSTQYFGVPNKDITVRINYNEKEDYFFMAVFCDEAKEFLNCLSTEELKFTKDIYKSIQVEKMNQEKNVINRYEGCLPESEIRYIKLSRDTLNVEIEKMFLEMSNVYFKTNIYNTKSTYDSFKNEYIYSGGIAKKNRHWKDGADKDIDISTKMRNIYV